MVDLGNTISLCYNIWKRRCDAKSLWDFTCSSVTPSPCVITHGSADVVDIVDVTSNPVGSLLAVPVTPMVLPGVDVADVALMVATTLNLIVRL